MVKKGIGDTNTKTGLAFEVFYKSEHVANVF